LTGSYSNYFHVFDKNGKSDVLLQADKSAFKSKRSQSAAKSKLMGSKKVTKKEEINVDTIDFNKKILHAAWHPHENSVAIAATNNLFIFSQI
jgi:serine/threonine-protein phosphatase 2A regulatory subunit B